MTTNGYEARQEARRERLERRAAAARAEAERAFSASSAAVAPIPMGQPILVGHHSERKHRRAVERANAAMSRGVEASKRAEELVARAASVGTGGVSSDDPEAIAKLTAQLEELRAKRDAVRAGPPGEPMFRGADPPRTMALRSLGASIRRVEKRIDELTRRAAQVEAHAAGEAPLLETIEGAAAHGGTFRIEVLAERQRIALSCSVRLPREMYALLKSRGWRWAPSEGAFLVGLHARGVQRAREAASALRGES